MMKEGYKNYQKIMEDLEEIKDLFQEDVATELAKRQLDCHAFQEKLDGYHAASLYIASLQAVLVSCYEEEDE